MSLPTLSEPEIRLECMKMAVEIAKRESPVDFLDRVDNLSTWLYNRVNPGPATVLESPEVQPRKTRRKGSEIFR